MGVWVEVAMTTCSLCSSLFILSLSLYLCFSLSLSCAPSFFLHPPVGDSDRKVTAQKMKTAGATGVLALQEHGLKQVPDGLLLLVNLRVSLALRYTAHITVGQSLAWVLDSRSGGQTPLAPALRCVAAKG